MSSISQYNRTEILHHVLASLRKEDSLREEPMLENYHIYHADFLKFNFNLN